MKGASVTSDGLTHVDPGQENGFEKDRPDTVVGRFRSDVLLDERARVAALLGGV